MAQTLRDGENSVKKIPASSESRKYDEAYRTHLASAIAGIEWKDVAQIVRAYGHAEIPTDGFALMRRWRGISGRFYATETTLAGIARTCAFGAKITCDAISRLEKYVSVDESFHESVKKLEADIRKLLDAFCSLEAD
ncbi:MAG: hypothetical protein ACYDEV_09220 [Acidiferrobacter sp.]